METLPWRHHHGDNTTRVECVLHINVMVLMVALVATAKATGFHLMFLSHQVGLGDWLIAT